MAGKGWEMAATALIAYCTRAGSTAEVAQAVGAALHEVGLDAEILPIDEIDTINGRATVILGAPLYMGHFPREFCRFLASNRAVLSASQCWCFVLGPTRSQAADFDAARKQAHKQLLRYGWFHPVDVHIFGGRWDAKNLPFPFSLARYIPGNPVARIPPADIRDWPAIHEWAMNIACRIASAA